MRALAQYRATRLESASKPKIVLMLFQEAIRRLELAAQSMEEQNSSNWRAHIHHAREIFLELRHALDDKAAPELCATLRSLYQWSNEELIAAGREVSASRIRSVNRMTTVLLEGWRGALEKLASEADAASP